MVHITLICLKDLPIIAVIPLLCTNCEILTICADVPYTTGSKQFATKFSTCNTLPKEKAHKHVFRLNTFYWSLHVACSFSVLLYTVMT